MPALILLLLTAYSAVTALPGLKHEEYIGVHEERFRPLRPWIPRGETVGFVTNVMDDPLVGARELYLAQYTLVPVIVIRGVERPLVVGDFYFDLPAPASDAFPGLEVASTTGTGVVLFRRTGP